MQQTTRQRQLLVAGIVTILIAVIALINNFLDTETTKEWVGIIGMVLVALAFVWAYLAEHETWAAIGSYVGFAIAFFILFMTQGLNDGSGFLVSNGNVTTEQIDGIWIPSIVLVLVALPFIWTWLMDRARWGFLIPAYVLLAIVPILVMSNKESLQEYFVPAYVMFAVGLPFVVGYLYMREWQLLVPGGILVFIALLFVGLHYGLDGTFLTIGVPIIAILIGAFLLWRAMTEDKMQREQ